MFHGQTSVVMSCLYCIALEVMCLMMTLLMTDYLQKLQQLNYCCIFSLCNVNDYNVLTYVHRIGLQYKLHTDYATF